MADTIETVLESLRDSLGADIVDGHLTSIKALRDSAGAAQASKQAHDTLSSEQTVLKAANTALDSRVKTLEAEVESGTGVKEELDQARKDRDASQAQVRTGMIATLKDKGLKDEVFEGKSLVELQAMQEALGAIPLGVQTAASLGLGGAPPVDGSPVSKQSARALMTEGWDAVHKS